MSLQFLIYPLRRRDTGIYCNLGSLVYLKSTLEVIVLTSSPALSYVRYVEES